LVRSSPRPGRRRAAHPVGARDAGRHLRDNTFWETIIRWFIAHPALHPVHHGPIIDYLYFQRFVPSVPNPSSRRRGQPRGPLLIPPQPNLTMKGRTPETLVRAVEGWHKRLGSERTATSHEWQPSGIVPRTSAARIRNKSKPTESCNLHSAHHSDVICDFLFS
jgi:hypothetical protein